MTDKQRVFIRGVKGRGSEVIRMLEDLGGKKPPLDLGGDPSYIYYISHEGDIGCMLFESEVGKIIMDNYREVKLPEKWKDGDILVDKYQGGVFAVFSKYRTDCDDFDTHLAASPYDIRQHIVSYVTDDFRLATPSEVERFHELLHKHCKDWDAEKKQLVSWKWKPSIGDDFWVINCNGSVVCLDWDDSASEKETFAFGNCFRTEEEAKAAVERVKKALKGE